MKRQPIPWDRHPEWVCFAKSLLDLGPLQQAPACLIEASAKVICFKKSGRNLPFRPVLTDVDISYVDVNIQYRCRRNALASPCRLESLQFVQIFLG